MIKEEELNKLIESLKDLFKSLIMELNYEKEQNRLLQNKITRMMKKR